MRVHLRAVGRLKGPEAELVARYAARFGGLGRGLGLAGPLVHEVVESPRGTAPERRAAEAAALLAGLPEGAARLALDERGEALDSEALAALIARRRDDGARDLALLVGGPDGLDPSLRAGPCLSLGRLTLPHGLARAVLAEQLYRAATLLAGHPYHRGR